MKRIARILCILCVIAAVAFSAFACGGPGNNSGNSGNSSAGETVVVSASGGTVTVKDREIGTYDYTTLFTITENGSPVAVKAEYVDASKVVAIPGIYVVTCTYKGKSADAAVKVEATDYSLDLAVEQVSVKLSEVAGYDFKALFSATLDGEPAEITDDMVVSTVKNEVGDYTYTVNFYGLSKTLTVHVVPNRSVEIVLSYTVYELPVSEIDGFDAKTLFSLYIDGQAAKIDDSMIDSSALAAATVGDTVEVTLNYSDGEVTAVKSASVTVVAEIEVVITARNVVTYPNGDVIDLTSLFTIKRGEEDIPVTIDMIEGSIDYSSEGENRITLTYGGKTATAVVEVKRGVIIGYAKGDTVTVRKGADKSVYPFADDFVIIINGTRFRRIPDSCFDLSAVNFDEAGTFTVTLTIKYNDQGLGLSGAKFEEVSETITYVVTETTYSVNVINPLVILPAGTSSYNPLGNLSVVINGYTQTLTTNPAHVDTITCYAQVQGSIDFSVSEVQQISVAVYVNGPEAEPVTVSFEVAVDSAITVSAHDAAVFAGDTVYARNLFTITAGSREVQVTDEMVSGKVDTFTPGVYRITADYMGYKAVATVIVYPAEMKGTYKTGLTTIPTYTSDDDDDESGWYTEGGDDYYDDSYGADLPATIAETMDPVSPLGDLVIEEGSITFNDNTATEAIGIDENSMLLRTGVSGREYTLTYDNGVVVLVPDNGIKLSFSDYARPLIYFKSDMWTIEQHFTVNYSDHYVLSDALVGYSMDNFLIRSSTGERKWYTLYVRLATKTSADTVYNVRWGESTMDNFNPAVGSVCTLNFEDTAYEFTVTATGVGKVNRYENHEYANMEFSGTVDGKEAKLVVNSSEWFQLYIENKLVLQLTGNDVSQLKNGGKLSGNRVFLYAHETDSDYGEYSYMFDLDVEGKTFTLEQRDPYYGRYMRDNTYIFLDGYGTGHFNTNIGSHVTTCFRYTAVNGELRITFVDTDPGYAYGDGAVFYISPLLNVLTVKQSYNDTLAGADFRNEIITDGAIVDVNADIIASESTTSGRQALLDAITVTTKDGTFTGTYATAYVNTDTVDFTHNGFCQFTINVSVGGRQVANYYAVQIITPDSSVSGYVGSYTGVMNKSLGLTVDKFGRAFISVDGTVYGGLVTVNEDGGFSVKAYTEGGEFISAKAAVIASGVFAVTCDGALRSSDYFASSSVSADAAGTEGFVIRRFISGDVTVYTVSSGDRMLGDVVTVTLAGDVYEIHMKDGSVRRARIVWGSASTGVTFEQ